MSSITGLGNQSTLMIQMAAARSAQDGTKRSGGPIDAAAKVLGISSDDLVSALKDGRSMADVAKAQGVSTDDLTAALEADAPKELKESGDVDAVVASMITQKGMPPQGPPPAGGGKGFASDSLDGSTSGVLGSSLTTSQQNTLDEVSSLLGTDSTSLIGQLRSGTSLASLLSGQKVDSSSFSGLLFDSRA